MITSVIVLQSFCSKITEELAGKPRLDTFKKSAGDAAKVSDLAVLYKLVL